MRRRPLFLGAVFVALTAAAWAEGAAGESIPPMTSAQIVEQMQLHDQARNQDLMHYHSLRHYGVEYRGFPTDLAARMDVEVVFDKATGKDLRIVSQSGSSFLIEKVLKRAVDSEREAFKSKAPTGLTPASYKFKLAGSSMVGNRPAYILDVEPLVASKFLYRGKVWVDAEDFAVVKMETQPSKSPSFWISKTLIHYTGAKADGFWMPRELRSETSMRIGGVAAFTIDYGKYEIAASEQASSSR